MRARDRSACVRGVQLKSFWLKVLQTKFINYGFLPLSFVDMILLQGHK